MMFEDRYSNDVDTADRLAQDHEFEAEGERYEDAEADKRPEWIRNHSAEWLYADQIPVASDDFLAGITPDRDERPF